MTAGSHHFVTTTRCLSPVPKDRSTVAAKPTSTRPSRESSHDEKRDAAGSCDYGKRRIPQTPHVPTVNSFRIYCFQNQQLLRPSDWREVLVRDRLCLANVPMQLLLCPTWPVTSPFIHKQIKNLTQISQRNLRQSRGGKRTVQTVNTKMHTISFSFFVTPSSSSSFNPSSSAVSFLKHSSHIFFVIFSIDCLYSAHVTALSPLYVSLVT